MAQRFRERRTRRTDERILDTGELAVQGELASIDTTTGNYVAGQASLTLFPVGYFAEELTGDGVKTVKVEYFRELKIDGWNNDTGGGEIFEANVGSEVFIKDKDTVTLTSAGNSKAGRVYLIEDGFVFVEAGPGVTGPTGDGNTAVALQLKTVDVPLEGFRIASSQAVLPAFADGSADGFDLADSESYGIRFNDDATPPALVARFRIPEDADTTSDMKLKVVGSKTGATVGDAVTFTIALFNQVVGALHDADTNYGGATSAMTGDATAKTVQTVELTLANADIPATVGTQVTMTFKPTDGLLGTDDVIVNGVYLEYSPRILP